MAEEIIVKILQPFINEIKYLKKNSLKICVDKTEAIVFKRKFAKKYKEPQIFIEGKKGSVKYIVKFLGVLFDHHFSFIPHVRNVEMKC